MGAPPDDDIQAMSQLKSVVASKSTKAYARSWLIKQQATADIGLKKTQSRANITMVSSVQS